MAWYLAVRTKSNRGIRNAARLHWRLSKVTLEAYLSKMKLITEDLILIQQKARKSGI